MAKEETKVVTMVEAIRQGIWEEMARDDSVFVIGEAETKKLEEK